MYTHSLAFFYDDSFLLDDEFDGTDTTLPSEQADSHSHASPDLGWEDQLDNGEEMSL